MKKTITDSTIDPDILSYTVGEDPVLDRALVKWDCFGTAAHVTMLSEMKGLKKPIVTKAEAAKVRKALGAIAAARDFEIRVEDQDVHMAVEDAQGLEGLIAAAVADHGQFEPPGAGHGEGLDDLGGEVRGRH